MKLEMVCREKPLCDATGPCDRGPMSTPAVIVELVERFRLHKEAYQASSYNETQVRREFIDPFFKALGWDIDNEQGYAEAYKDVVHEDAVKIGGNTKSRFRNSR